MKIVVIGASGTIGSAVAKLLRQRHQVIAVSRSSGDYFSPTSQRRLRLRQLSARSARSMQS
jgi:nucleoside-diphosphate-sugar epimerase